MLYLSDEVKYLGIVFDWRMNWKKHVDENFLIYMPSVPFTFVKDTLGSLEMS